MDEKAIELVLGKLEELGRNYGPAFSEQAVKYAHIKAIENTFVPLIVCALALYVCRHFYKDCKETEFESFYHEVGAPFIAGCAALTAIVMFLVSLNPAAWYGLFDPVAYLSYRLFEKVL